MTSFCWILSPTIFLCLAWSLSTKTIFTQSPLSSLSTLLLPGTAFFTMKIEVITWEPLQLSIPAWLTCVLTHLFLFPPDTANNMCFWSKVSPSTYALNLTLSCFLGTLVLSINLILSVPLSYLALAVSFFFPFKHAQVCTLKKESHSLGFLCPCIYYAISSALEQSFFKKLCAVCIFSPVTHSPNYLIWNSKLIISWNCLLSGHYYVRSAESKVLTSLGLSVAVVIVGYSLPLTPETQLALLGFFLCGPSWYLCSTFFSLQILIIGVPQALVLGPIAFWFCAVPLRVMSLCPIGPKIPHLWWKLHLCPVSVVLIHVPTCSIFTNCLTGSTAWTGLVLCPNLLLPHLLLFQCFLSWEMTSPLPPLVVQARKLGVSHVASLFLISHIQSVTKFG